MRAIVAIGVGLALGMGLATAQEAREKASSSAESRASSVSRDGKTVTRSFRRVIKDGKVVEESGDPAALEALPALGIDLDELVRKVREGLPAADAKTSASCSTRTRRIVVKNGEVVEDEETSGGPCPADPEGLAKDLPGIEELLRRAGEGAEPGTEEAPAAGRRPDPPPPPAPAGGARAPAAPRKDAKDATPAGGARDAGAARTAGTGGRSTRR